MRCDEFEARLDELLDQRRKPDSDLWLTRHRRLCPHCRAVYDSYEAMLAGLSGLESPEPPVGMAKRVVNAAQCVSRPQSLSPHRVAWFAVASAICVALFLARSWNGSTPTPVADANLPENVAGDVPESPQPAGVASGSQSEPRPPAVGALARQATARYADLARDTGEAFASILMLVPDVELTDSRSLAADSTEYVSTASVSELAQGFRPVATSAASAVSFLFNVLPGEDDAGSKSSDPVSTTAGNLPDAT